MISFLVFRDQKFVERSDSLDTLAKAHGEPGTMVWVDLSAPAPDEVKRVLQDIFGFHPLAVEDCVSDSPFPKLESYDEYLYLVLHTAAAEGNQFQSRELDLFLGKNYLVTYHHDPIASLDAAIQRFMKTPEKPVRGPDRFAQTAIEAMIDSYTPVLDAIRQQVEKIEEGVLNATDGHELFPNVIALRKQLSRLRQVVRPQRLVAEELTRGKSTLIRPILVPYLRDDAEQLAQIEAQLAAWADQLILSFRLYLNRSSHEANEGIRILTAMTALSFPALLVGGWFGMNFHNMHELSAPHGYAIASALTLAGTYATWLFMRRKHWL